MVISAQYSSKISKRYLFWCRSNVSVISGQYCTNISLISNKQVIFIFYWTHTGIICYKCQPNVSQYQLRTSVWILHQCQNVFQRTYWWNITPTIQLILIPNPGIHAILAERRVVLAYYYYYLLARQPNGDEWRCGWNTMSPFLSVTYDVLLGRDF